MDEVRGTRLLKIGGTAVFVQLSFLILCAIFVILDLERGRPIEEALLWVPILFVSVVIHEASHAVMIAMLGFGPSVILLGGFGGVTINARTSRPWQEIVIAAAGPLSSFALGFLLFLSTALPMVQQDRMLSTLIPLMAGANFVWGVFNLLPIYPLDGGLMTKHLARYFASDDRAVRFSAISSMVLATVVAAGAVIAGQYFLAAIAGMLLFQNWQRLQTGDPF